MQTSNRNQIQRITTKAIFCRNGRILCVKDKKGNWELPGGTIRYREKPQDALGRELYEELSFRNVRIGTVVDAWDMLSYRPRRHHFIVLVFECFARTKTIKISDEHVDFAWVPFRDIWRLTMEKGYKKSIQKYQIRKRTEI